MFEKLDKLREEVRRCEKRRDDANEKLKAAQAKLKDAEASQILSDVGALNLSPEQVARLLQLASAGALKVPTAAGSDSSTSGAAELDPRAFAYGADSEAESEAVAEKEEAEDETY